MNNVVKGALAAGALLIVIAGFKAGLHGQTPPPAPPASPPDAPARTLAIAAAADLKFALDELVKDFRASHPGVEVQVTYGASGNFVAQLSQGAPFDLFLSADVGYPRRLVEQGLVLDDDIFLYAVGHLVLWVPRDSPLPVETLGMKALLEPAARHIALANPQHAPYGRAAQAALQSQGVHEAVRERLVLGENVAQTAQLVQSGAADVGLIALSLALAPAMKAQGRYGEIPPEAYPRMDQGGVILRRTAQPALARELRELLTGPQGQALLQRYGFFSPQR